MMDGGSGGDETPKSSAEFKDDESESSGGFLQVFDIYEFSFLLIIFTCNFAQGFRRLLELGLYIVFK